MINRWISVLIIGMTLGTAWAIRGQFGHEQGAAWAGGIGAMGLVLVSQRRDWYQKIFSVALASAIGWGAGGMISYGMVVGYGRSDNFPNTLYGLSMLFVIGGLFGLMGGGLTGLALESSGENKAKWANLITEMAAGGLIVYYFLVEQLGILMTPPRSEAWAICLGAGLAMIWYILPLIIFRENFQYSGILERLGDNPIAENGARLSSLFAIVVLIVLPVVCWFKVEKTKFNFTRNNAWHIFVLWFLSYILISYVVTGLFAGILLVNHHLYVLNLIIILYLSGIQPVPFSVNPATGIGFKAWSLSFIAAFMLILALSFLSINIHRKMPVAHDRFPVVLTMCHSWLLDVAVLL